MQAYNLNQAGIAKKIAWLPGKWEKARGFISRQNYYGYTSYQNIEILCPTNEDSIQKWPSIEHRKLSKSEIGSVW